MLRKLQPKPNFGYLSCTIIIFTAKVACNNGFKSSLAAPHNSTPNVIGGQAMGQHPFKMGIMFSFCPDNHLKLVFDAIFQPITTLNLVRDIVFASYFFSEVASASISRSELGLNPRSVADFQ